MGCAESYVTSITLLCRSKEAILSCKCLAKKEMTCAQQYPRAFKGEEGKPTNAQGTRGTHLFGFFFAVDHGMPFVRVNFELHVRCGLLHGGG